MPAPISVTLSENAWVGLLMHLKDTVNSIPITAIEPDPYQCVNIAIAKIEQQLNKL
jgi:ribosome-associated translation inhibitor RaiA